MNAPLVCYSEYLHSLGKLFHLPDVVGFKQLREVVIVFLLLDVVNLVPNGVVVSRRRHVANYSESHWESLRRVHESQLHLQCVVLAVCIVHENIVFALAVKFGILFLSAAGLTNMWWAVFGDVGVLILAILNAMRCLLRVKDD